jgi:hypothetical protein
MFQYASSERHEPGTIQYNRGFLNQFRNKTGPVDASKMLPGHFVRNRKPVDTIGFPMKCIIRKFILQVKCNKQNAAQRQAQSNNFDKVNCLFTSNLRIANLKW